jgi:hypothetical protein
MNECEEMESENTKAKERIDNVRSEVQRMAEGCRSLYLVAITPGGEMCSLCFYNGYADMKAMQAEAGDRLAEIIAAVSKRVPSQAV